jgi:hypothetical protein
MRADGQLLKLLQWNHVHKDGVAGVPRRAVIPSRPDSVTTVFDPVTSTPAAIHTGNSIFRPGGRRARYTA